MRCDIAYQEEQEEDSASEGESVQDSDQYLFFPLSPRGTSVRVGKSSFGRST